MSENKNEKKTSYVSLRLTGQEARAWDELVKVLNLSSRSELVRSCVNAIVKKIVAPESS